MSRLNQRFLICGAALGLIGSLAGSAWATPVLPSRPDAAFHLGQNALNVVGQIALQNLPPQMTIPEVDKPLGLLGMVAHVTNGVISVTPHSLTFAPQAGSLGIAGVLDVSGTAHVSITNAYITGDTASCDIAVAFTQLSAGANVSLSVDNGLPTIGLGQVTATVPEGDLSIQFSNCPLEGLNGGTLNATADAILDLAQGLISDKLDQVVPPLLQTQISGMLSQSGNLDGYGWAAKLTTLEMTAEGVDAYAQVAVDYEGQIASCLPPTSNTTAVTQSLLQDSTTMSLPQTIDSSIVVGVSTKLVSSAVAAAWQSGLLCIDSSLIAKLGFDPEQLVKLVPGLPAGMQMSFSMGMDNPPNLVTGGDGSLTMVVQGAELLVVLQAPGQPADGIDIDTDFSVTITPTIDPTTGSIYVTLGTMIMNRLDIHAGATNTSYTLDPERMTVLMQDVVAPLAAQKLKGLPVSAASFAAPSSFGTVYTWLDNLYTTSGAMYLGLEAFVPPTTPDHASPQTLLQKTPGPMVRAGMARFTMAGSDDVTPPQLIRYTWQLDGGAYSTPAFGQVISAPVTAEGMHVFRVAAVDLAGNVDPNVQSAFFTLDPTPPTLTVTQQPAVVVRQNSIQISFTGSDDETPANLLSYAYRVGVRTPGGDLTNVQNVETSGLSGGAATITVDNLRANNTYEVTVLLYDEAGNVTSQKVSFGVASFGCSMVAGDGSTLGAFLLIAFAILASRRRRRA